MKQVLRPTYPDANMPKITLHENETMDSAMERFYKKVSFTYSRPWYKRRYGYYEKPSRLQYKRHRMQRRNRRNHPFKRVICPIGLTEQFERTGRNAIGE